MKLIFDAHLDLSLCAIDYNRDLRRELDEIREEEKGLNDLGGRGAGVRQTPAPLTGRANSHASKCRSRAALVEE